MTERALTPQPQDLSRAAELYRSTQGDLSREIVLNTQVVALNERGIATRSSFNAIMGLIRAEVDPSRPVFMPNAVSDLSGENLVGIATANFHQEEGESTQTLMSVADRIRNIGARVAASSVNPMASVGARPEDPASDEMGYIFQEMAGRLADDKIDDEARRGLVEALDRNVTPEFMEHILEHQPELMEAMIRAQGEFRNRGLRRILERRDQMLWEAPEGTSEEAPEN